MKLGCGRFCACKSSLRRQPTPAERKVYHFFPLCNLTPQRTVGMGIGGFETVPLVHYFGAIPAANPYRRKNAFIQLKKDQSIPI